MAAARTDQSRNNERKPCATAPIWWRWSILASVVGEIGFPRRIGNTTPRPLSPTADGHHEIDRAAPTRSLDTSGEIRARRRCRRTRPDGAVAGRGALRRAASRDADPGPAQRRYDGRATIEERENTDVATTQPVVKLTYEDYRTTLADERYELLDGNLIMVPAPNLKHQRVQFRLGQALGQFILHHELGEFFYAPCDVVLSDTDIVQPDLLFVSRDRAHLLRNGENVQGGPDLVIEILSPSTADKDRGIKRELYSRHGVKEYWLIDPMAETVSIHRQQAGRLAVTRTFGRRDTLRSPLLAGLELRLDDVFPS